VREERLYGNVTVEFRAGPCAGGCSMGPDPSLWLTEGCNQNPDAILPDLGRVAPLKHLTHERNRASPASHCRPHEQGDPSDREYGGEAVQHAHTLCRPRNHGAPRHDLPLRTPQMRPGGGGRGERPAPLSLLHRRPLGEQCNKTSAAVSGVNGATAPGTD
jgi:hypothetical protein